MQSDINNHMENFIKKKAPIPFQKCFQKDCSNRFKPKNKKHKYCSQYWEEKDIFQHMLKCVEVEKNGKKQICNSKQKNEKDTKPIKPK